MLMSFFSGVAATESVSKEARPIRTRPRITGNRFIRTSFPTQLEHHRRSKPHFFGARPSKLCCREILQADTKRFVERDFIFRAAALRFARKHLAKLGADMLRAEPKLVGSEKII